MIYKRAFAALLAVFLMFSAVSAQKTEITISLSEGFFDALLESVFKNFDPPQFSIAQNGTNRRDAETQSFINPDSKFKIINNAEAIRFAFTPSSASQRLSGKETFCEESIKILREMNGVRTSVRFRDGKIYLPLAFSGGYAPPFVGCIDFAGWAETNIELEFDLKTQQLVGRAKVLNVNLNGTGGIGGTVIARLIQGSIDKKLNPIEILSLEKISFGVPIRGSGNLKMKALGIRTELGNGMLNIHVDYEFLKG